MAAAASAAADAAIAAAKAAAKASAKVGAEVGEAAAKAAAKTAAKAAAKVTAAAAARAALASAKAAAKSAAKSLVNSAKVALKNTAKSLKYAGKFVAKGADDVAEGVAKASKSVAKDVAENTVEASKNTIKKSWQGLSKTKKAMALAGLAGAGFLTYSAADFLIKNPDKDIGDWIKDGPLGTAAQGIVSTGKTLADLPKTISSWTNKAITIGIFAVVMYLIYFFCSLFLGIGYSIVIFAGIVGGIALDYKIMKGDVEDLDFINYLNIRFIPEFNINLFGAKTSGMKDAIIDNQIYTRKSKYPASWGNPEGLEDSLVVNEIYTRKRKEPPSWMMDSIVQKDQFAQGRGFRKPIRMARENFSLTERAKAEVRANPDYWPFKS